MIDLDEIERLANNRGWFHPEPQTVLAMIQTIRAAMEFQNFTHWGMAEEELKASDRLNETLKVFRKEGE